MKKKILLVFVIATLSLVTNAFGQIVELHQPENYSKMQRAHRLEFEWSSVPNIEYYQFQLSKGIEFNEEDIVAKFDRVDTNVTVFDLSNNRTYFWRVRVEKREWSEVWNFSTTGLAKRPIIIAPENETLNLDTNVNFVWTSNELNKYYNIEVSPSAVFTYDVKRFTLQDTSINVGGLKFNTRYYWHVAGVNVDEELSSWSSIYSFQTILDNPVEIFPVDSASYIEIDTALAWNKVAGANIYTVQFSNDSTFNNLIFEKTVEENRIKLPLLTYNRAYFWRLKSFNDKKQESNWSRAFRFYTNPGLVYKPSTLIDTINLTLLPRNTLMPIQLINKGDGEIVYDSIKVFPDTLFSLNKNQLSLLPFQNDSLVTFVDTSILDTSFYSGKITLYSNYLDSKLDSVVIGFQLSVEDARLFVSTDTLMIDSTLAQRNGSGYFYVANKGIYPLTIKSLTLKTRDSSSFKLVNPPKLVPARDSVRVYVLFSPDSLGLHFDKLLINTNSYKNSTDTVVLVSSGFGPSFSKESVSNIEQIANSTFETFLTNFQNLKIVNNGGLKLNLTIGFENNYFELNKLLDNKFILESKDSLVLPIKYLTPNFDTLNIDTLRIWHNSFGKNPIAIPLRGSSNNEYAAELVFNNLKVNNKALEARDYIFDEKRSISFSISPELFEDYKELKFRIKYFVGGPGKEKIAVSGGSSNFVIPYSDVDNRGLLFSGELIAHNKKYNVYDSLNVFDYLNGQVVNHKYTTSSINVPYSLPISQGGTPVTKWVIFGFPTNDVITDSLFTYFGGREMMKDGEWVLYEYGNSGFSKVSDYYLTPGKAYFVAQSLLPNFELNYTYKNDLLSRKLTDTLLNVEGEGWRAITSPYTFDVEVDSSTILYTYDYNSNSYRITSIMRPGVGYFVDGDVKNIKLKTHGEYYPDLFPKILSSNEFAASIIISSKDEQKELFIGKSGSGNKDIFLKPAPELKNGITAYFINSAGEKSILSVNQFDEGITKELIIQNATENKLVKIVTKFLKLSGNYSAVILNEYGNKLTSDVLIEKNKTYKFKVLIGTNKYLKKELKNYISTLPNEYTLFQNFPNPFNPETIISFQLPISSKVNLSIYNMLGEKVATPIDKQLEAGYHNFTWNTSSSSEIIASGVYIYRLIVNSNTGVHKVLQKKMLLLK